MLDPKGFDLWANGYDKSVQISDDEDSYPFAGYKVILNRIYQRIRAAEAHSLLDVGIGTATLAKKLYDDGLTIWGVDFSPEMLRIAQAKMPEARLLEHDFSHGLPEELLAQGFDTIVCTYAIHHLGYEEQYLFLKQLKSLLNPGGEILLGDVMFASREELLLCQYANSAHWDYDEFYPIFEELCQNCPFEIDFIKVSHCSGLCVIR